MDQLAGPVSLIAPHRLGRGSVSGVETAHALSPQNRLHCGRSEPDLVRVKKTLKAPVIVDGRNILDAAECAALGFTYLGVGRPGLNLPANGLG